MHTNSQQHTPISPESKTHQSQLTDAAAFARAILKKCLILADTCGCELMTLPLVSESFSSHLGICLQDVMISVEIGASCVLWQL